VRDRRVPAWLPWALTAALTALLVVIGAVYVRPDRTSSPSLRTNILAPENLAFSSFDFALSPDGSQLAFVTLTRAGASQLWASRPSSSNTSWRAG